MLLHLLFIPSVAMMIWALYTRYIQNRIADLISILLINLTMYINATLVYELIEGDLGVIGHLIQMTVGATIIPLSHTYFQRSIGKSPMAVITTRSLWYMMILVFVPQIIFYNPLEPFSSYDYNLHPYCIYVLNHGEKLFAMYTGDLVVVLQALLAVANTFSFALMLRSLGLQFNGKVRTFGIVSALSLTFCIIVSTMSYEALRSASGMYFYYGGYVLSLFLLNLMIAKDYTVNPLQTNDGNKIESVDKFMTENHFAIAKQMQQIMEVEELYLDAQLTSEYMVKRLNTNRTYFSQMMQSIYQMSFSDYVSSMRLNKVVKLLDDPHLSINEIATRCGFSNSGYMSRKFKARYGLTPTEWRIQRRPFSNGHAEIL